MDTVSAKKRSEIMGSIRSKNTSPELIVRHIVFKMGYRYRLFRTDLPGKPDLAFIKLKKVIFVNGCFWHGHNCRNNLRPKTNEEYWNRKITQNIERDKRNYRKLNRIGWSYCVIWECETRNSVRLTQKIIKFLCK